MRKCLLTEAQMPPEVFKPKVDQPSIKRNFKAQPPLIPHTVDKYEINLKINRCLKCHDKPNYEDEEAPMVGKSHYIGPDGKERDQINMSRYFCSQCHVPQTVATPLVENSFVGTVTTK